MLPNKDSSVGRVPENAAKSDSKKGNICPSPVSDSNTLGDDPHTCSELLLSNSNRFWSQLARRAAPGVQIQAEIEHQQPLSWGVFAHRLATGGRLFVLMQQEKKEDEEFEFGAMYRQEWGL